MPQAFIIMQIGYSGLDRGYNRNEYLEEKKDALQTWADHLTAIVEGRQQRVLQVGGVSCV